MTTLSTSGATPLTAIQKLQAAATLPGSSRPASATASVQPATPAAAAAQATQGAAAAQPAPEIFNAPQLELPPDPTTREVMGGLARAMADPSVNESSAQKLYQLHEQLLNAERGMIQAVIDGMLV